jgi:hypothetical protein
MDERWKRTEQVTMGDDKGACMEEEFPEVSTSATNQEM